MKSFAVVVLTLTLNALSTASDLPTCVIIRHASTARQVFVSGANWQYVEGDFPKGMKWKSNVTDRNVRKIKELGGRVVVIPNIYSPADLQDARAQCKADAAN